MPDYFWSGLRFSSQDKALLKKLQKATTFAFDAEEGASILQSSSPFDLYVLDGDFPDAFPQTHRDMLRGYIGKTDLSLDYPPLLDRKAEIWELEERYKMVWNNFAKFYDKHLLGNNVVVFSASRNASYHAFVRKLPFFFKNDRWDPRKQARSGWEMQHDEPIDMLALREWQCGGPPEFIHFFT